MRYRDIEYVGDFDENGWPWNGDIEAYENPENWLGLNIEEKPDGTVGCWFVLMGSKWTHEVQVKDEIALDGMTPEQKQTVYREWMVAKKATGKAASDPERWARENS